MRFLYVLHVALFLAACDNGKTNAPETIATQANPEACIFQSTGAHTFISWGPLVADQYLCQLADLPKMTCHFYQSEHHREIQCSDTISSAPQNPPNACGDQYDEGGQTGASRLFFNGQRLYSDAFDCGVQYSMRCTFFMHRADSSGAMPADDFVCLDDQLPN